MSELTLYLLQEYSINYSQTACCRLGEKFCCNWRIHVHSNFFAHLARILFWVFCVVRSVLTGHLLNRASILQVT